MINIKKHMELLGLRVIDLVSGFTGVVTAISFDLYGCIQAIVNPGIDKDGKPQETRWFDVARLKVADEKPVMEIPDFDYGPIAEGRHGPSEKPRMLKP